MGGLKSCRNKFAASPILADASDKRKQKMLNEVFSIPLPLGEGWVRV